jgi:hypothetical protein
MDTFSTEIPALRAAFLIRNREKIELSADPAIPFFRAARTNGD